MLLIGTPLGHAALLPGPLQFCDERASQYGHAGDHHGYTGEAESPPVRPPEYELRRRGPSQEPPPGFGSSATPEAAAAAERAASVTCGPIKKRLKVWHTRSRWPVQR